MERIGDEVSRELGRLGPAGAIAPLSAAWPEIVGEAIARHAWPARISRDGTLHVATDSSTWAFELSQLAAELTARLRTRLGGDAPKALRFAVGVVPAPSEPEGSERAARPPEPTSEERELAAALAAEIGNAELRRLVARAAAASLARAASDRGL